MMIGDTLSDREPQACAFCSARDHGQEQAGQERFRNAGSVIDHLKGTHEFVARAAHCELAEHSCPQRYDASFATGLRGVAHQVKNRLRQLSSVSEEVRQARVIITNHFQRTLGLCLNQLSDVFDHLMNVRGLKLQTLVGA